MLWLMKSLIVDCASCQARPRACADCVMSVLLGAPDEAAAPELCDEEQRVLGLFASAGLLPPLRLVQPVGTLTACECEKKSERIRRKLGA